MYCRTGHSTSPRKMPETGVGKQWLVVRGERQEAREVGLITREIVILSRRFNGWVECALTILVCGSLPRRRIERMPAARFFASAAGRLDGKQNGPPIFAFGRAQDDINAAALVPGQHPRSAHSSPPLPVLGRGGDGVRSASGRSILRLDDRAARRQSAVVLDGSASRRLRMTEVCGRRRLTFNFPLSTFNCPLGVQSRRREVAR